MSSGKRRGQWRSGFRFCRKQSGLRTEFGENGSDAGEQPPATERRDNGVDVRQLLENLQADGPVSGDESIIVERVDEMPGHTTRPMLDDRSPAFIVARAHD